MRLLCLHGVGSSARICESQFRPFLKAVDPSYEFIFVDGPVLSRRGPGIGPHLEGPFYSHTTGYSPKEMQDAQEHLDATIEELGPFDGVLGFSQGAALTISYIFQRQACGEAIPFDFALFFSSVIPCSADAGYCEKMIQRFCSLGHDITEISSTGDLMLHENERLFIDLVSRTVVKARKNDALLPEYDMNIYTEGDGSEAPRVMHPQLLKERITMPTVHVTGKRDFDFMRSMSDAAYGLCDIRHTKKLEHSGSHHPPQKTAEVNAVVRAMEWAITQSQRESTGGSLRL
ncbi:DUF341 domain protein [Patellaria atrata CBS 101060]|uniref:DUF341 domain protein n=1 Tax=Patellaria atrata CBS 101060 TaxID=1346257 RepID=A0A9P4SC44_9PEZI|nr:DUF341 domain protein [Patellaria atrata CBS 101060]